MRQTISVPSGTTEFSTRRRARIIRPLRTETDVAHLTRRFNSPPLILLMRALPTVSPTRPAEDYRSQITSPSSNGAHLRMRLAPFESRRDATKIARRFNAGTDTVNDTSPVRDD